MSKSLSGKIHPHDVAHHFVPNEKVGSVFTTSMHIICAVVGIGVLALPYSIAYLGWIAGPLVIFFFWLSTWLSSSMLSSLYLVDGHVYGSYHHLVNGIMGRNQAILLSCIQVFNLILVMIAYAITGGLAVTQVRRTTFVNIFYREEILVCIQCCCYTLAATRYFIYISDIFIILLSRLPTWLVHLKERRWRKFQMTQAALV